MTDFAPWLRPTIVGPFLSTYALVTWAHLMFGDHADEVLYAGHHFDSWVASILVTSFVAAAIVVSLIVADIALLRAKMRRLPSGFGAWLSAMLAPFALHFAWMLTAPSESVSMLELAIRLGVPFPASALAIRCLLGEKP